MDPAFDIGCAALPLVTTALHAGHELRPEVAAHSALDDASRRREEDPGTERLAAVAGAPVTVHRSRFEVDLNRPRERAVYTDPGSAWGLDVWRSPPSDDVVERSLAIYDEFYEALGQVLDPLAALGPFLVLDVHSYNHRRRGASEPPAPASENPEVNLGTGALDRDRWGGVVEAFAAALRRQVVDHHRLDVRENVRFEGGHLAHWVGGRYPGTGAALAVELKKTYMDEWTGRIDGDHLDELCAAFAAGIPPALDAMATEVA